MVSASLGNGYRDAGWQALSSSGIPIPIAEQAAGDPHTRARVDKGDSANYLEKENILSGP